MFNFGFNEKIADSSPDFICITNEKQLIEYFNTGFKDFFYPKEIITNSTLLTDLFPDIVSDSFQKNTNAKKEKEFMIITDFPEKENLSVSWTIYADSSNNKTLCIGKPASNHPRNQSEQLIKELNEVNARYNSLFHNTPHAIQSLDIHGNIIDINHRWLEKLEYSRDEVIGKWFGSFLHKDQVRSFNVYFEKFKKEGILKDREFRMITKTNKDIYVSFDGCIHYDQNGNFNKTYCYFKEITLEKKYRDDLVESQRKLTTLMKNLRGMAYRCQNKSNWPMEYVSDGCLELTGYTSQELSIGGSVSYGDLIHPADQLNVWKRIQKTAGKNNQFEIEYRISTKNGSEKWVWERGIFIDNSGQEQILEGFISDITDYKTTQKQLASQFEILKLAKEKAEESEKLKTIFLANISHEIRTPMNGIMGFINVLKKPGIPFDKQNKYLDIISESSTRMINTLNDIISISRIEAGEVTLILKEVNINNLLSDVYHIFLSEAHKKNLNLFIGKLLPDNKQIVTTDKEKIITVFSKLITNSLKFTSEGEIEIGVQQSGEYLTFYVRDTGIGIPKEKASLVFSRFAQVHDIFTTEYEGSGLGIPISKAFVELMGGKIWYESPVSRGTIFYFKIPA